MNLVAVLGTRKDRDMFACDAVERMYKVGRDLLADREPFSETQYNFIDTPFHGEVPFLLPFLISPDTRFNYSCMLLARRE